MLITRSIALLALLQPTPSKPTRIPVEEFLAGGWPGQRIEVAAVILPTTAIQLQGGGVTRYFALAVAANGPYFKEVARVLDGVRAEAPGAMQQLEAAIEDDASYKTKLDDLDKLVSRMEKLAPAPVETVAIELQGFDGPARVYNWATVVGDRSLTPWRPSPLPDPPFFSVSDVSDRIKKLSEERPPALAQPMPRYTGMVALFSTRAQLRDYRKMVKVFNAELYRRRRYSAQLVGEELTLAAARLERILSFRDEVVAGTVIVKDDLAARTFAKTAGGVPSAWLRETAPEGQTAGDRHFARNSVLVASFPPGATLTVAGKPSGLTPALVPDLAAGTEVTLAVEHAGFVRKESIEKVTLAPTGVRRIEMALNPAGPAATEADEVWLVEDKGATLTVSQEASIKWTSSDPEDRTVASLLSSLDNQYRLLHGPELNEWRPELILRCAGGQKEAYLYSALGFGAIEGDIFLRFENDPKSKKYQGAASRNGLSLFFTGFWDDTLWSKGHGGVIKAFLQHQTMTLTVKPKKKEALPELTFDLRGLDKALAGWLEACPLK